VNLRPAVAALGLLLATRAAAQTVYTASTIDDLPTGGNVFALLEGAQPEIVTDQFNSGGINTHARDRMSGFLASWTQTLYRIGDVAVSSPFDGRTMVFPEVSWMDGVSASLWQSGVDATAPGLTVSMRPRAAASSTWAGSIEAMASGGSLARRSPEHLAPAVTALEQFDSVSGLVEGVSMGGRLRVLFGAASSGSRVLERGETVRDARTTSLISHSTWQLAAAGAARLLVLAQDDALHVQGTIAHGDRWRAFAGFTRAASDPMPRDPRVDRLVEGPVSERAADVARRDHLWAIGARGARVYRDSAVSYGFDLERGSMSYQAFDGTIYESVNGIPARAWQFGSRTGRSRRHALEITTFIADRVSFNDRISSDLALRFSSAHGAARDAAQGIGWNTLEPLINLRFRFGTPLELASFIGVSRVGDRLRLNMLAAGDPYAEAADVYRWDGVTTGALVARAGPGTGGSDTFSTIDPDLRRPITDEFRIGASAQPWTSLRLSVTGVARRQRALAILANVGVSTDGYTVFAIPDPNVDLVKPDDDQLLPVYDRKPESFGADRYQLTNPNFDASSAGMLIVSGEWRSEHVFIAAGGTAQFSGAPGVNRGYTAIENDPGIPGEAFTDPNAATHARGRLFNDRAYTLKVMSVVTFPAAVTLGAIARYQDGQPFARVQIATGLNQGPEVIQAFSRGRSRFTFRSTLDLRLSKRVVRGRRAVDLVGEVYNLVKMANEVEESVVTGPRFRETTAVQPPRSFHLGLRVAF
jgi:hypothetical protein